MKQTHVKYANHYIQFFLGVAILLGVCYGMYLFIRFIADFLSSAKTPLASAIITVSGAILVGIITSTVTSWKNARNLIEKDLREKKSPIYQEYINFMGRYIHKRRKESEGIDDSDMVNFIVDFNGKLLIWGGDDVVLEYVRFRNLDFEKIKSREVMLSYERMIRSMRKDLGHSNKGLEGDGVLLSTFVNNVQAFLRASK